MISRNYNSNSNERRRQIDTLKVFNDGVVEVNANSEYEIEFVAGNSKMCLEVILGVEFPNEKPTIKINPMVTHPWIDTNSRIITGAPGLLNFTVHSDLGRVVQAIIREFERKPPPIIADPECEYVLMSNSNSQNVDKNPSPSYAGNTTSPGATNDSSILGLDDLSEYEMQQILSNPDHLDKFIETLPQTLEMEKTLDDLMQNIKNLANINLSKKNDMQTLVEGITERTEKLIKLKDKYDKLNNEHKKLCQPYSPLAIMESLRSSMAVTDSEAEKIAQEFLDGSIETETFLKNYEEKRSLGLTKRAKQERLSHQLIQFDKA